jgi:hypothetical protein
LRELKFNSIDSVEGLFALDGMKKMKISGSDDVADHEFRRSGGFIESECFFFGCP